MGSSFLVGSLYLTHPPTQDGVLELTNPSMMSHTPLQYKRRARRAGITHTDMTVSGQKTAEQLEEAKPLKGIGDLGESIECTVSNGSQNGYRHPRGAIPTMKPLNGIGDPNESNKVTVSNGSSNGNSNPRAATTQMIDAQQSPECTSPAVSYTNGTENGITIQMESLLDDSTSGQNGEKKSPKRTAPGYKCFLWSFGVIFLMAAIAIIASVLPVVLSVTKPQNTTDVNGTMANKYREPASQTENPGTNTTSGPNTAGYRVSAQAECTAVVVHNTSQGFNESLKHCQEINGRLFGKKDTEVFVHCIPKREDVWAINDGDREHCYIYNTAYRFVKMDCDTQRRSICMKNPDTT